MGQIFFLLNRFQSDSGTGRKINFELQTVKVVKLGGVKGGKIF